MGNGRKSDPTFVCALIGLLDRFRELARPESDILGNMLETSRLPRRVRRSADGEPASELI
jgi:hypothetical protein